MKGCSLATGARSLVLVASLALGLLSMGCGSSDESAGGSTDESCEPTAEDYMADALGAERAVVERGRADAGFDQAFGDESEALLDDADDQRAQLIEQAAADLGLELPDRSAVSSCAASKPGVIWEPLSASFLMAFGISAAALKEAVRTAPTSGTLASKPYTTTSMGKAADGSPTTTVTSFNITTTGRDSQVTVTTTMSSEVTTSTGTTKESAYVAASADVCPDPGGVARGNLTAVLDGSVGDASSYHADFNQSFDFIVNDQASIVSTDLTCSLSYRATGKREADVSMKATASFVGDSNTVKDAEGHTERSDGSPESEKVVRDNILLWGTATAIMVRPEAEKKWRGGKCVELTVEPSSQLVDPDAELEVTAKPRHRFDMSNVDATVVTSLTGVKTLNKQGERVAAPATYQYIAGSEPHDQGTLKLKSTSKRGIAEAVVTYTVKCDEKMECPEGKTLNLETCQCECSTMMMTCGKGQIWDDQECACVCAPKTCAANETWDSQRCECVCDRECPDGTALNEATCQCDETCEIDPTYGNTSANCGWAGTFSVSMSDSGTVDVPDVQFTRTINWATMYEATAHLLASGPVGFGTVQGTAGGDWHKTDITTYPEPAACTLTDTESASVQSELGSDAYGTVLASGDGKLNAVFNVGQKAYLTGTHELVGSGYPCDSADPDELSLGVLTFMGSGTPSRDVFSGSSDTEGANFLLPDGRYATFHFSWSLRLVRR